MNDEGIIHMSTLNKRIKGTPVTYKGKKVGEVEGITYHENEGNSCGAKLDITATIKNKKAKNKIMRLRFVE